MQEIRLLQVRELCLSGYFGNCFLEKLKTNKIKTSSSFKAVYLFDGNYIYIKSDNFIELSKSFDESILKKLLNQFNKYIEKRINEVKNLGDSILLYKIINLANDEVSRKSRHHIFNIELLTSAAKQKSEIFDLLYNLMTEREFYNLVKNDYEYYLFAIFDADSYKEAIEIYDILNEESLPEIDENSGYRKYRRKTTSDFEKKVKIFITNENEEKITKNLQLVKID